MLTRSALLLSIAAVVSFGSSAIANTLTITGGFTNFAGVVGGGQYTTVINGTPVCPYNDCTATDQTSGDGSLDFGSLVQNVDFSFSQFGVPSAHNVVRWDLVNSSDPDYVVVGGEPVKIADLFFQNGTWFGRANFGFTLFANSCDAAGVCTTGSWSDTVVMDVHTVFGGSGIDNADNVRFEGQAPWGGFYVLEPADSATPYASIAIMAMIGSLIPTGFGPVTGDSGFFVPAAGPSAVPLPAALPLFAAGLGALGCQGWRRRRKTHAA